MSDFGPQLNLIFNTCRVQVFRVFGSHFIDFLHWWNPCCRYWSTPFFHSVNMFLR